MCYIIINIQKSETPDQGGEGLQLGRGEEKRAQPWVEPEVASTDRS